MKSYNDYFYAGTFTLQNKLGITDVDKLAAAEAEFTRARARQPIEKFDFTPEAFQKLHHHLFQDLYPWAGQFRTVDVSKIDDRRKRVPFERGALVTPAMKRFCGELGHDLKSSEGFRNPATNDFAYRAAVYLKDLNYIHPFVEGNGRIQRLFLGELARHSGHRLGHTRIDPKRWMEASRESYLQADPFGPHSKMSALIRDALRTPLRERAEQIRRRPNMRNNDRERD